MDTIPSIKSMYQVSSNGIYILSRDNQEIMRDSEQAVWKYIHNNHGYSVHHALQYEGYSIRPEQYVK